MHELGLCSLCLHAFLLYVQVRKAYYEMVQYPQALSWDSLCVCVCARACVCVCAMQMLPLMAATSFEHRGAQCLLTLGRSTSPPLDQFPVCVCSCPLCIINRLCMCVCVWYVCCRRAVVDYWMG